VTIQVVNVTFLTMVNVAEWSMARPVWNERGQMKERVGRKMEYLYVRTRNRNRNLSGLASSTPILDLNWRRFHYQNDSALRFDLARRLLFLL